MNNHSGGSKSALLGHSSGLLFVLIVFLICSCATVYRPDSPKKQLSNLEKDHRYRVSTRQDQHFPMVLKEIDGNLIRFYTLDGFELSMEIENIERITESKAKEVLLVLSLVLLALAILV